MYKQRLVVLVSFFVVVFIFFLFPKPVSASSLTGASVTMSNSRMSYKAGVAGGTSGSSLVTISNSGFPDINTNHLFPGDIVCFTDAGQNGCIGSTTYSVDNIIDATHFNLTAPLGNNLDTSGYAVSTQSGTFTMLFTIPDNVPIGGSLIASISAAIVTAPGTNHDGIPDSAASVANSGFDLNKIASPANISITTPSGTCPAANWGVPSITYGAGGAASPHSITLIRYTSICQSGAQIQVVVGSGTGNTLIVNPAPITTGHTQGTADIYGVTITTRDSGGNTIDNAIPRVAPVEAVLISANVDESLSFQIAGVGTGCGNTASASATAYSIPWGHIPSANTFMYADQTLTVNTNAANGYSVTIQENDQMGKNGVACPGIAPSSGNYTFGPTAQCIRDTTCIAGGCSATVMADWTDPVNYVGLGYSLASGSGTDATFFYNQGGRIFNAKELPDIGTTSAQVIMSNSGPVSNNSVTVCYKIAIPGNQPSGYYYNIAKYTATATF